MILPRWLLRTGWAIHRVIHAASGGRLSTLRPGRTRVGTLFLVTVGRRTGAERRTGLYYLEDGPNLVVVGSNAGAPHDPAWWRNLQAHPAATVELRGRRLAVTARLATAEERERLWPALVRGFPPYAEYERATARPIPVIILEPAASAEPAAPAEPPARP